MKKQRLSAVCMALALFLLVGEICHAAAPTALIAGENAAGNIPEGYIIYQADFAERGKDVSSPLASKQKIESTVEQAKDFVASLHLSDQGYVGLERALLDELDSLSAQKVQLESYAVALPRGHQEYYGTYNGYMFQAAYSTYNESYSKTLYGKTRHEQWVRGAANVIMCFVKSRWITIPYAVLSSIPQSVTFYEGARTDWTNEDEVTSRYIMIQDKDHKLSLDTYSFIPMIKDMVRVSHTSVVTYSGSPYQNPVLNTSAGVYETPSENFYNKQYNMSRGYNRYLSGNVYDYIEESVGRAAFRWS